MATVALAAWFSLADIATIAPAGEGLGLAVPLPGPASIVALIAMGVVSWRCWGWTSLPLVVLAFPLVASRISAAWIFTGTGVAIVWATWAAGVVGACGRIDWLRTTPVRAAVIAGAVATVWLGAAAFSLAPVSLTGDAPHYLTLAQSVLEDGDFDLKNNYDARTYDSFYRGSLEPRHTNQAPWGQEYSFHGPGVSMLVLPGLAAFGAPGATATLVLLLAFGSALQWLTARRLTGSAGAAWFGWAALVGSAPYTLHAAAIYPDGPAAVAVTVAVWLLVRLRDPSPTPLPVLVAGSVGLAALPWLHVRLALPAGVIGSSILLVIIARQPDRWTRCLWFVAIPVISCAAWFAASFVMFDTWNPAAAILQRTAPGSWSAAAAGLLGMLADAEFGLFPTTPVMVAVPIAFVLFARRYPFLGGTTGLVAAGVWGMSSFWVWWGGDAAPARFLTVVLPIFSLWLAHLWVIGRPSTRRLLGLSLAISVALTTLLVRVDGGGRA